MSGWCRPQVLRQQ